uniref:Ig-like domain-containing protein n=1 Tax=Otolemur garnettii TaxID=30611 RepID=H0XVU1_OTOGA
MPLPKALIFSSLWVFGLGNLEQSEISISRGRDKSAQISCTASIENFNSAAIHWYRQKTNQGLEHLLYVTQALARAKNNKFEARKEFPASIITLKINSLEKEDEAMYYCAWWSHSTLDGWIKIFGEGTKVIVTSPDQNFDEVVAPKPTIFLPSLAETTLHNAGTYLCLLENFVPDVIKVYWKEKNSDKILESQQGDTRKAVDGYMKFSWLTVPEMSLQKEHQCVVKHESYKGANQEILFPPI